MKNATAKTGREEHDQERDAQAEGLMNVASRLTGGARLPRAIKKAEEQKPNLREARLPPMRVKTLQSVAQNSRGRWQFWRPKRR